MRQRIPAPPRPRRCGAGSNYGASLREALEFGPNYEVSLFFC